jgi:hypothetical protein
VFLILLFSLRDNDLCCSDRLTYVPLCVVSHMDQQSTYGCWQLFFTDMAFFLHLLF